jgi:hypothetical protein
MPASRVFRPQGDGRSLKFRIFCISSSPVNGCFPCIGQQRLVRYTRVCHFDGSWSGDYRVSRVSESLALSHPTHLAMLVDDPHFQATNEGELVFLLSDGDSSRRPDEHGIVELEEENGTARRNYYLRIPLEHPDSQRWRAEIAKYLAPLVLGGTYNSLTPYHNAHIPLRASLMAHSRTPSHLHCDLNAPRLPPLIYT